MANNFPSNVLPNFINFTLPSIQKSVEKFDTSDKFQKIYQQDFSGYGLNLEYKNLSSSERNTLKNFYLSQKGEACFLPVLIFDKRFPSVISQKLKLIPYWLIRDFETVPVIVNDFRTTYNVVLNLTGTSC